MSKSELLKEITKLTPSERSELWDALWTLETDDWLAGSTPSPDEKAVLDAELEDYGKDSHPGAPWSEVEARLRDGK